jgi:hypothetical protein
LRRYVRFLGFRVSGFWRFGNAEDGQEEIAPGKVGSIDISYDKL